MKNENKYPKNKKLTRRRKCVIKCFIDCLFYLKRIDKLKIDAEEAKEKLRNDPENKDLIIDFLEKDKEYTSTDHELSILLGDLRIFLECNEKEYNFCYRVFVSLLNKEESSDGATFLSKCVEATDDKEAAEDFIDLAFNSLGRLARIDDYSLDHNLFTMIARESYCRKKKEKEDLERLLKHFMTFLRSIFSDWWR